VEIPMEGYRGSHPVRIGNDAFRQRQLDTPGYLVILSRRWAERGEHPDDDYWPYLHRLVDGVCERWTEPDRGIWEVRGEPEHFVHSKAMCWAALDGAFHIADVADREVEDAEHWGSTREEIRREIEQRGYDEDRGIFVRTFDGSDLDAALLLLPSVGFVDYDDPRMVRTADAIRDELSTEDGLLRRYTSDDGLSGDEGVFLAASFWLVECLARQGRRDEARSLFDRVVATRNDLGLFGEEYDPEAGEILGNYPQGLTHLAHIGAAMALAER
jgi:GH15 family glucan-1,4-alpha-glucosidase